MAGTALAAALGRLFSRPVIQPVTDLTEAAEHITATEDLARRVDARGSDEVGRMAARFNTMLDTLEGSVAAQRRLVADASHELRTPVTSLRTNIEVLLAGEDLPEPARRRLLEDVREQTEELSGLITDVIELARGEVPLSGTEDVRLDEIAAVTAGRVGRSHPDVRFELDLEPSVVEGLPDRLARAVGNLLDNAAKYGPPGGVVEVRRARRRGRRARPRPGRAGRRGAVRVRSLLPRRRRPRAPGLRPRAGDRAPGRRVPRRRRDGRGGAGRRRAVPPAAAG